VQSVHRDSSPRPQWWRFCLWCCGLPCFIPSAEAALCSLSSGRWYIPGKSFKPAVSDITGQKSRTV